MRSTDAYIYKYTGSTNIFSDVKCFYFFIAFFFS